MALSQTKPKNVDEYIRGFAPPVKVILERIRQTIRDVAPDAKESISYRMPTFSMNGALVYFAAFKEHIGFYPPVSGDEKLEKAVQPYAGEKGCLRFKLDRSIPYDLIKRIVKLRIKQNLAKTTSNRAKRKPQKV